MLINQRGKSYEPCTLRRHLTKFKFLLNLQYCELKTKFSRGTNGNIGIPGCLRTKHTHSGKETKAAVAVKALYVGDSQVGLRDREQIVIVKYHPHRQLLHCKVQRKRKNRPLQWRNLARYFYVHDLI